jgi:hypothetical protein
VGEVIAKSVVVFIIGLFLFMYKIGFVRGIALAYEANLRNYLCT